MSSFFTFLKKNLIIVLLTIVFIVVLISVSSKPPELKPVEFSKTDYMPTLKELRSPMLSGGERSLTDWQGKIIVLNFWATWCPPCIKEIPMFIRMQQKWHDKNVQFIGFSVDDADKVRQFAKKYGLNYPNMLGVIYHLNMTIPLGNVNSVLPFTIILDENLKVVDTIQGEAHEVLLDKILQNLQRSSK